MSGKLLFLKDARVHSVGSATFQELCHLRLEPGPHLVIAKGAIQLATTEEFQERFALRLEAISLFGAALGADTTEFGSPPTHISAARGTFSLMVAADVPFEGGAGSPGAEVPPPPRAILSAASEGGDAVALVHEVRIAALRVDEILLTTLEATA